MAVSTADPVAGEGLLNKGIYDGRELARLIHRDPDTIARWTARRRGEAPLLESQAGGLFTFLDLISLYVISELVRRGVTRAEIARGANYLADHLGTTRPYAHKQLATVGRSFFAHVGEWVDAGKQGQGAFPSVIRPLIKPIEYGRSGLAVLWRPHEQITINPRVQAGAPCIDGTRVPTALVARLAASETAPGEVADDFGITVEQVEAARDYEERLRRIG